MSPSSNAYLKTVDRALEILLQFSEEHPEWSSSELANVLGLHRSVVYRILSTLERRGFVTRVDQGTRFRLGFRLVELGNVVLSGLDLREIAHPVMEQLVRETKESAFLTVFSEGESVCIDRIESGQQVRVTLSIGGRYPLHAGASNKVLLAYQPPDVVESLIASGLMRYTDRTITDPVRLKRELTTIRRQGWAFSVGELPPGVAAIAAPLRDSNGKVVAALSIAGLESRFQQDRFPMLLEKVLQAARVISGRLLTWRAPLPNGKESDHECDRPDPRAVHGRP